MAGDWPTVPLSQLYDFSSGLSKPSDQFGFGDSFLTFKDVLDNYFVPNQLSGLVNSTRGEQTKCSVQRGDVFLTRTSETQPDLGMSCVAIRDYPKATFNGFTKRLRPLSHDRVVPEFAAYYFRGPKFRQAVTSMSSLSTRASLNNEMLSRLTITLPPIRVQKAIGCVLKSLDDKIELNRRMNETLEGMARALFKSWFVDFDPVRAKLDRRPPPGLDPATAALVPDHFEHTSLGLVPKGWSIGSILDHAELLSGGTPKTDREDYWGGDILWASAKDVSQCGETFLIDTERTITGKGLEESATQIVPALSTVVVARGATTGRMVLLGSNIAMNQTCYALASKQSTPLALYCLMRAAIDDLVHAAHGSVFDTITTDTFARSRVVVPPPNIALAFETCASSIFNRILINTKQSRTLAALRDALLPKLLSGEIRIPAAEKLVEEVA